MRRIIPTAALLASALQVSPAAAQRAPANGAEVLQRMHDAYAGKWYHTLTFVQKTTQRRPDGTDVVSTWYESLRHTPQSGTQLRIDIGQPSAGNGIVYTADSSWRFREGKLVSSAAQGNEFLPLIEGVYVQPVEQTVKELQSTRVDMQTVGSGTWQGRAVWIVGAAAGDSTKPQFWIDRDRNVVVRMLMGVGGPNAPMMDIHLDKYEPLAGGWLATKVTMLVNGVPRQTEEYSDWKAGVPLDAGLFAPATYSTAKHWVP